MRHSAFTIVTEVADRDGAVAELEALLNEIGDDIDDNPHLRFADLSDLHYASFSVVAEGTDTPYLVFEGNVDGRTGDFLRQLVHVAGGAVHAIYRHCAGFPAHGAGEDVVRYLHARDIGTDTFYVAWPGWSVEELRREQRLRERLEELLDGLAPDAPERGSPASLRAWVLEAVRADPALAWAARPAARPFLVRHGGKVLTAGLAPPVAALVRLVVTAVGRPTPRRRRSRTTLMAIGTGAAVALGALYAAEVGDDRRDLARDPDWQTAYARWADHLGGIRHREDVQVQNHMISVTRIKPGRLRFAILRTVLWVIDAVARLVSNKGSLGGIASIHFARWVITPDRKHLIFLSNFDGSWESYLSDFIDQAAFGLTAVWTNTDNDIGFPRTRLLVTGGARDEVRFKAYARSSMVPTNTWYSAYPTLTVANMDNNMRIRRDLFADLDDDGARDWLRRL